MPEQTTIPQTTQTAQPQQASSQAGTGQQGSESIVAQAQQIRPRPANELDLSRLSGGEQQKEVEGKAAQTAQAAQPEQAAQAQPLNIQQLIQSHPELAKMAQRAAMTDQLTQRMNTLQPYEAEIRKMMEEKQKSSRNKGDMTADFNQVFGAEYGGPVMNLLNAFLEEKMAPQLGQYDQRLQGVEGTSRNISINGACDAWHEKLRTAMKDDGKSTELIQTTLAELHARNPNFSPQELDNAIAMRVSQLYTQSQMPATNTQQTGGKQQGGAHIPSTQAAQQRLMPSEAEAQRRIDGTLEGGQAQGGQQLGPGDQATQEADRILDEYRDWG